MNTHAALAGRVFRWVQVLACAVAITLAARAAEELRRRYDFPAGDAATMLRQFAEVSGREILFAAEVVRGVRTSPVRGELTALEALQLMLAGTNLYAIPEEAIAVRRLPVPPQAPRPAADQPVPPPDPPKTAQPNHQDSPPVKNRTLLALLAGWLAAGPAITAQIAETGGTLTGTVSNAAIRNMLEGARITVPQLNLTTLTDNTGRYVLTRLPAGSHEVVVSYAGLDSQRTQVVLAEGERVARDFDLKSEIYQLAAFKVVGEREGEAAAITAQRNAENVKNVVAMDSFGNLPNMSASEVLMRLPGAAGTPSEEGIVFRFTIRGMDWSLNSITLDGGLLPAVGTTRSFETATITSTMFESMELIKGHTPDKGADSLGGTVNLKTRSPLSMRENRRTTYSFTTRWAPPFLEQTPWRQQHRAHPLITLADQQVFDLFGGKRNLGVALNLFYSENAVGGASTTFDYQNTLEPAAYIWDYRTWDNYNNRKQQSVSLRADYRWSSATKFSLTLTGNDNFERQRRRMEVRAYTGNATVVPNATTSGIVAGAFTVNRTVVRPVTAAIIDIMADGPLNYDVRTRRMDFGAEHKFRRLQFDYAASQTSMSVNSGWGSAGRLTMRLAGAGWIVDRSAGGMYARFLPAGGPDFTDWQNYRPAPNGLQNLNNQSDQALTDLRFNARYEVPSVAPLFFKAGLTWRRQQMNLWGKDNHRWSYAAGGPAIASDPSLVSYASVKTGLRMPLWQSGMVMDGRKPRTPSLWVEDLYYHESQNYTATSSVTETVPAAYLMADGKLTRDGLLGRTGYLAGVRVEDTNVNSWGWVRSRFLSTAAQQVADPVGSAARDYAGNYRKIHGDYSKFFPSAHLYHDFTPNLKGRISYSTSFGRPAFSEFLPSETIDETNHLITVNNPDLKPQTAGNWDATLEYYFEPVGSLTVAWFHKSIRDYILRNQETKVVSAGADNGYNGEYSGWTERTSLNAGSAVAQGLEFAYNHQLSFLPGLLKGLGISANYTWINTHGLFDAGTYLTRRQVPGFIPNATNLGLSWRYGRFSSRVQYNFTGEYVSTYNLAQPALSLYLFSRRTLNAGFGCQLSPPVSLSVDVANILNEPVKYYRGFKNRTQRDVINFVTITAGINGRF